MAQSEAFKLFLAGSPPKNLRLAAARGLVPLPRNELLTVMVRLCGDADGDVAAAAHDTLRQWPEPEIIEEISSAPCAPEVLAHFAGPSAGDAVREAIVLNNATPAEVVARLARDGSPALLELILYNRIRILQNPSILASIKRNPRTPAQIGRIVLEIEAEFFNSRKSDYLIDEEGAQGPAEPQAGAPAAAEIGAEDLWLEGLPSDPDARETAILQRLATMSVRQKIQAALLGNRQMRTIMIRSANQEISRSVLKNPKVSETEIEGFAAMRNVSEEILRQIAGSRAWTRSYAVVQNLVRNPKTPPVTSQRLLSRLQSKDLALLARDRGVGEAVRRNAQRMLQQRSGPKQTS